MKKFTKLFLSCAAITAVTAAVATSAMASEIALTGELEGTYDTETGKLAIVAPTDLDAGSEATLLVIPATVDDTAVTADDVTGIDQATGAEFANTGLKDAPQVPETGSLKYTVKVGYYVNDVFTIKSSTLLLGEEEGINIIVGDTNLDGTLDGKDAGFILRKNAGYTALIGKVGEEYTNTADNSTVIIGDTNIDGTLDGKDAGFILRKNAGYTSLIGKVGEELVVVPAAE